MKSKEEEKANALFLIVVSSILIVAEIVIVSSFFTLPEFIKFSINVISGIFIIFVFLILCMMIYIGYDILKED